MKINFNHRQIVLPKMSSLFSFHFTFTTCWWINLDFPPVRLATYRAMCYPVLIVSNGVNGRPSANAPVTAAFRLMPQHSHTNTNNVHSEWRHHRRTVVIYAIYGAEMRPSDWQPHNYSRGPKSGQQWWAWTTFMYRLTCFGFDQLYSVRQLSHVVSVPKLGFWECWAPPIRFDPIRRVIWLTIGNS